LTALHLASKAGHSDVVIELLKRAAPVDALTKVCTLRKCDGRGFEIAPRDMHRPHQTIVTLKMINSVVTLT